MKNKIIVIISLSVCISLISLSIIFHINNTKINEKSFKLIKDNLKEITTLASKYEIKTTGNVLVTANYKGAHGENYPNDFVYKYELTDKLYMENEEYTYLDVSNDFLKVIDIFKKLEKIDVNNYNKIEKEKNKIIFTYDEKYINDLLNTKFNKIELIIKTTGLYKRFNNIEIYLDDIKIELSEKDIDIFINNNEINIIKSEKGYYLGINGNFKCNIFINDDNYNASIVLNNSVYSITLKDEGIFIKLSSGAAIYNSIDIDMTYEDINLKKKNKSKNFDDNPIIRYLSKSDLSIWRK